MNLKKLLAGVLACCVVCGALPSASMPVDNAVIAASAADYTEGKYESLTYRNYGDHIEIFFCDTSATSVIIPDKIDGVPVTSISGMAFSGCTKLTEITIPDSITEIGRSAFSGCTAMTSINVSDNNNYYTDIDGVLFNKDKTAILLYPSGKSETKYTIPNSITNIGSDAFYSCTKLTEITIPDSVTEIGFTAISSCTAMTSINVSDNNNNYTDIDGVLFNKDKTAILLYPSGKSETKYTIPNSVTSISSYAFEKCSKLTEITIPDSVTSIGSSAFRNCKSLTEIIIPDSVTSISSYAFEKCSKLTGITIPDSVTIIDYDAFADCSELTEITIPDSVTSIGVYAFLNCKKLRWFAPFAYISPPV